MGCGSGGVPSPKHGRRLWGTSTMVWWYPRTPWYRRPPTSLETVAYHSYPCGTLTHSRTPEDFTDLPLMSLTSPFFILLNQTHDQIHNLTHMILIAIFCVVVIAIILVVVFYCYHQYKTWLALVWGLGWDPTSI